MTQTILHGITWDHPRGFAPLAASIDSYMEQTGIAVQWQKRSLKDFGDASLETLARTFDLIIMDHPHVGVASSLKCVVPLEEILPDEFILNARRHSGGPSFGSYQYDDHLWALPIDAACQVSCRRDDLFKESRLPQQWEDVLVLAERVRANGLFIGIALCPTDCNCCFLTLCAQFGEPVLEWKFPSSTTGRRVLSLLKKLYTVSHPGSSSWNPVRLYDHMASENDVVYSPLAFGYTNYARPNYGGKQLRYGAIPGLNDALLGGAGIAVSAYSHKIKEAAAYASWLCSDSYQCTTYVETGGQPAHKMAWTDASANEITGCFFSDTLPTLEAAYVRPRDRQWPVFQEELGEIIHSGLVEDKRVETIWDKIIKTYDRFY